MTLLYLLALVVSMSLVTMVVFFAPGFISMGLVFLSEHKSVLVIAVLAVVIFFAVRLMS